MFIEIVAWFEVNVLSGIVNSKKKLKGFVLD
jgi:hypothetical protein